MLTQLLIVTTLAASFVDPFAPSVQHLSKADFDLEQESLAKPSPYPEQFNADDLVSGLEWAELDDDWGETVRESAPLVEVLSTRQGKRIIYSALLCHSEALLASPGPITDSAYRRLVRINTMAVDRLTRAQIVSLACDKWPVERLVQCLGLLPTPECSTDPNLALQVKAATRLETMP
jgi:hypothetical protein